MQTNLKGRVKNTQLPYANGLLPLFEAVVNSIHAIEEGGSPVESGKIRVEIHRRQKNAELDFTDGKKKPGPEALGEIIGFEVTDNGVGFDEVNMESFDTLDSDHKEQLGCRGIGRLLWLKAFQAVRVESTYIQGDKPTRRRFTFNVAGVSGNETEVITETVKRETTVRLEGFRSGYRDASLKTLKPIANSILEHCLWYFIRIGGAPLITVYDDGESIILQDVFDADMPSKSVSETIEIKGVPFELTHVRLRSNTHLNHTIALCADNRLVSEEKLAGKVPGLHKRISDEKGEFVYSCYVSSPFLDNQVRPERTGFTIAENVAGPLLESEIVMEDIRNLVAESAKQQLADHLAANLERARDRVDRFVTHQAPRYRPILARIPSDQLNVDPDITDKELDLTLHKQLAQFEGELLREGHDIMDPKTGENIEAYRKRLADYLDKAEDIKKSDLASYVSHRKVILDIFANALKRKEDGNYERESVIHELIMPMGIDSTHEDFAKANLWLVDERLAFHEYLGSDKTLHSMPITGSNSTKEADLCALNLFDNPILVAEGEDFPLAAIVVVELKRPMRNDAKAGEEHDPIEQALGYVSRIRAGNVLTRHGRPVPASETIPGYCYILCDLTPKMIARCKMLNLTVTSDGMGFFGYNQNFKSYIEVSSFERLVKAARERNRAFFDKLGLPAN